VKQLPPADAQQDGPDENGLLIWIHSLEDPGDDLGHEDLRAEGGDGPRDAVLGIMIDGMDTGMGDRGGRAPFGRGRR
jgi:hypothetical protein